MDKTPQLFMLMFSIAFVLYCYLGIYVLIKAREKSLNRAFFAICSALAVCSAGYAMSVNAPDVSICLLWRRFSFLGSAFLFSFMLHFMLLLTESKALATKWICPLLYFPAFVSTFVFVLSDKFSGSLFNLVITPNGWISIPGNSLWHYFYVLYYSSFIIAGIYLLWQWGKSSHAENGKIIAAAVISSIIGSFVLKIIADVVPLLYSGIIFPQMEPLFSIIPMAATFHCAKLYGLLGIEAVNTERTMLHGESRTWIYRIIAGTLIVLGIADFGINFIINKNGLISSLVVPSLLLLAGMLVQAIKNSGFIDYNQDSMMLLLISLIIPVVTLQTGKFGSITIWAFPFVMIMAFVVFSNKEALTILALSIIATQAAVWIEAPNIIVHLKNQDYGGRIVMFAAAIYLAFYINKIYLQRMNQNTNQMLAQQLVTETSADFMTADSINVEGKINRLLERIADFFGVERAYLYQFDSKNKTISITHEWLRTGTASQRNVKQITFIDILPWAMDKIKNNEIVHIPDVEELPYEAAEDRQRLLGRGIHSLIYVPLTGNSSVRGFMGIDSSKKNPKWEESNIRILKTICNILSEALTKIEAEDRQLQMAYYDQLTKLPNRVLFNDRVQQAIHQANRTESIFGVMMIDLDSFKLVNDSLGHERGDELLKKVSQELAASLRKSDTVARFGGDEFLILINNVSKKEDIIKVAKKIMDTFKKPFNVGLQEFFVTSSGGVVIYPVDGETVEDLVKNADLAMYNAKEKGKNQFVLCASNMKGEVRKVMELSNSLYYAQEYKELSLFYQPQIDIKTGEVIGLEALLRWKHPRMGMVLPKRFIPLAEKTGLINPIGAWVIENACRQNVEWQNQGLKPVRMAVNISFVQLRNPKLICQLQKILGTTGMDPRYLELEITESVAMLEPKYNISMLNKLKKLGLTIAIDDFGTEYSSLSRLKQLPVDRIKMDMQFVKAIDNCEKDRSFAEVIISLAKGLGLGVIAEGVETETQLRFLSQKQCEEAQGYYFSEPKSAEEIKWLLNQSYLEQKDV